MTYLLGWSVIPQIVVRRERWPGGYKTRGTPLVYPGQEVQSDQPVIRLYKTEKVEALDTTPRLVLPSVSMPAGAGGGNRDYGYAGNGNGLAGDTVPAGLVGRVVDITGRGGVVIESRVAAVEGTLGAGNQVAGVLTMWRSHAVATAVIPPGAILVVPGPLNFTMLRQALSSGIVGIVASSISLRDLEGFLQTDLISLLNSEDMELAQAHLPPLTLLFTEGLGTIAMPARTVNLLSRYQGSVALLAGATSVRQGLFPELLISLPLKEVQRDWQPVQPETALEVDASVRICSGEHEGAIGEIEYLFSHEQVFASGIHARAARIRLEDGSRVVVPLTLLERIG
ncbi:MAG TPA: hypothetical protein VKV40_18950 [Ktedonobacteraceae bacterium]|nr:hypothetical protein [Ktedonobacteraceae bacterium]